MTYTTARKSEHGKQEKRINSRPDSNSRFSYPRERLLLCNSCYINSATKTSNFYFIYVVEETTRMNCDQRQLEMEKKGIILVNFIIINKTTYTFKKKLCYCFLFNHQTIIKMFILFGTVFRQIIITHLIHLGPMYFCVILYKWNISKCIPGQ